MNKLKVADRVRVFEDAPDYRDYGATSDRRGAIGFITEIHPYPRGCEPPYEIDFQDGEENDCYYDYDLERIEVK